MFLKRKLSIVSVIGEILLRATKVRFTPLIDGTAEETDTNTVSVSDYYGTYYYEPKDSGVIAPFSRRRRRAIKPTWERH